MLTTEFQVIQKTFQINFQDGQHGMASEQDNLREGGGRGIHFVEFLPFPYIKKIISGRGSGGGGGVGGVGDPICRIFAISIYKKIISFLIWFKNKRLTDFLQAVRRL